MLSHKFLIESAKCPAEDLNISQYLKKEEAEVRRDRLSVVFKKIIEFAPASHDKIPKGFSIMSEIEDTKSEIGDSKKSARFSQKDNDLFEAKYKGLANEYVNCPVNRARMY